MVWLYGEIVAGSWRVQRHVCYRVHSTCREGRGEADSSSELCVISAVTSSVADA